MTQSEDIRVDASTPNDALPAQSMFQIAWRRKWLLALGAVIGGILGGLQVARSQPIYKSAAQILVAKKRAMPLPLGSDELYMSMYDDFIYTHQRLIGSPVIVREAVRDFKLSQLASFQGNPDPTSAIIGSLSITRESKAQTVSSSEILDLAYKGPVPEDCEQVLNAIIASYTRYLAEKYKTDNEDTVTFLAEKAELLKRELAKEEEAYEKFRQKAHDEFAGSNPLIKAKDGTYLQLKNLTDLQAQQSQLRLRWAETSARLALLEDGMSKPGLDKRWAAMLAEGIDQPKSGEATLNELLRPLKARELELLQDFGPDHREVQSVRDKIKSLIKSASDPFPGLDDEIAGAKLEAKLKAVAEATRWSLKKELAEIEQKEKLLTGMFKGELTEAGKHSKFEDQDAKHLREIKRTQDLYDGIVKRLQAVHLVTGTGGFDAQVISPATPGVQVARRAVPIFSMAIIMGILGGFGFAYLAHATEKTFHTPEEIRRRLGLPVLGHIPILQTDEGTKLLAQACNPPLDPSLCTVFRPKSAGSEAYRSIRTSLFFSTHSGGHKVIQITSPNLGDGKTTLIANLAVSIAQSGKKILIIDADFRRPRIHKIFGVPATEGLASLIAEEVELPDAVKATSITGLSILPCGPIPPNPAELLTSPRFPEIIAAFREQFDYVLVDTPPLLAVTDPAVVAPRVDGVFLVLRLGKNVRPQATRARDILATLNTTVLGVVVNGFGGASNAYSYYQGAYSYRDYSEGADKHSQEHPSAAHT